MTAATSKSSALSNPSNSAASSSTAVGTAIPSKEFARWKSRSMARGPPGLSPACAGRARC